MDDQYSVAARLARLWSGEPPRVVDLFAGAGGMTLGFQRAGYTILGGVENDANAARTHAINFIGQEDQEAFARHAVARDIKALSPEQFMKEVLGVEHADSLVDVIVGGPPCQAFARIGRAKLQEIMGKPKAHLADDRASLYIPYLEYVEFFRPLAVVMENVPEIMSYGGRNIAEEIASSLEDMGYRCRYTILNAAHYGVPQLRQRFYLIALLDDFDLDPSFPDPTHYIEQSPGYLNVHLTGVWAAQLELFDSDFRYINPPMPQSHLLPAVTVREALGDLPPINSAAITLGSKKSALTGILRYRDGVELSAYAHMMREWPGFESPIGVWDHVTRYLPRDFSIFGRMKHGDQYPQAHAIAQTLLQEALTQQESQGGALIPVESEEYRRLERSIVPPYTADKFPNKWWKMEPNRPSRTLTAHLGRDGYSHIHYEEDERGFGRVISVREAARLQSFPDGFRFGDAMNPALKQIGNAVPPLQAFRLARHIKRLLREAARAMAPATLEISGREGSNNCSELAPSGLSCAKDEPMLMPMSELTMGDRVHTADGYIAEIVSESKDRQWISVRYIDSKDDPAIIGTDDLCHASELESLVERRPAST